jgi:type I restriction enzyme, S subunit
LTLIPKDWTKATFEDIASIANGQVDPKVEPYLNYPHVGPENVSSGTGRLQDVNLAKDLGLISGKYLFDEVAIVYSKIRPNLNKVCIPGFVGICSADMYPIWSKNGVHQSFLFQYMLSTLFVHQTTAVSGRTGLPKINREDLNRVTVLIPPLAEQRKIAAILGTWDAAIVMAEKLVAALRARKRALMQRLLTGESRFPGFEDDWTATHLGKLFSERRESGRLDLPLLSITNNQGVVPREMVERRDTSAEDKSKYLRICDGDIGYNTMRMWQGVSAVSKLEGIVSPAYTICIPAVHVDANFMGYLFKFAPMIHLLRRYSQGLVDDTLSLKFNVFAKIPVSLPSLAEQKRIAGILKMCDEEIAQQEYEVKLLKQQKRGLMQRLLTGEVRVELPGILG